jgi:hypothetical protein
MLKLYELTQNHEALLERIYDDTIDEQSFYDSIEAIEELIQVKADGIAKINAMAEYDITALDSEIKRLTAKKKTIENGQKRLKDYLYINMSRLGIPKIKTDLFTISIRKNPAKLIIDNPEEVPTTFLTIIPEHTEINNAALKDALKTGEFVTGAHLENGESLQIK